MVTAMEVNLTELELGDCLADVVRSMRFPSSSTQTRVNIPYVFDARKPVQNDNSG